MAKLTIKDKTEEIEAEQMVSGQVYRRVGSDRFNEEKDLVMCVKAAHGPVRGWVYLLTGNFHDFANPRRKDGIKFIPFDGMVELTNHYKN